VWVTAGFRLVNGFTDHLHTRPGITSNYSATANLHNSQMTTAPAKPFPACCVSTSRSLAMASNSGDSSDSRSRVLSPQPPMQNWTELTELKSKLLYDGRFTANQFVLASSPLRPTTRDFFQLNPYVTSQNTKWQFCRKGLWRFWLKILVIMEIISISKIALVVFFIVNIYMG
jgi:hypothetical protein